MGQWEAQPDLIAKIHRLEARLAALERPRRAAFAESAGTFTTLGSAVAITGTDVTLVVPNDGFVALYFAAEFRMDCSHVPLDAGMTTAIDTHRDGSTMQTVEYAGSSFQMNVWLERAFVGLDTAPVKAGSWWVFPETRGEHTYSWGRIRLSVGGGAGDSSSIRNPKLWAMTVASQAVA